MGHRAGELPHDNGDLGCTGTPDIENEIIC